MQCFLRIEIYQVLQVVQVIKPTCRNSLKASLTKSDAGLQYKGSFGDKTTKIKRLDSCKQLSQHLTKRNRLSFVTTSSSGKSQANHRKITGKLLPWRPSHVSNYVKEELLVACRSPHALIDLTTPPCCQ